MKFIAPKIGLKSFSCPHCGAISRHYHWGYMKQNGAPAFVETHQQYATTPIKFSQCEHCKEIVIWYDEKLIFPDRGNAPLPNSEMPEEIKSLYEEAALILSRSPRGASALLRLAIQKLSVNLGGSGKNINEDIKHLVKNGLPSQVQKALDVVRVTGNNAVHPGQIDVDDPSTAGELFILINIIVDYMISLPKKVDNLYDKLPEQAKEAISNRDNN